jgi:hypothetical protein
MTIKGVVLVMNGGGDGGGADILITMCEAKLVGKGY